MAGHHVHVLPTTSSLIGQIQTQTMSHAKFVFLIVLVVFFIALFVAAYLWMRRPDFGQKGGRPMSSVSGSPSTPVSSPVPHAHAPDGDVVPAEAAHMPERR
jgi:hypothetical protein